ncbi:MAG: RNA methyltransferase [Mycobacteriaceae bacterium]
METFTERTPRVASAVKLHRGVARRKAGRFLAEGAQAVREALAFGVVHELFCTADAATRHTDLVSVAQGHGVRVSVVSEGAAGALSDTVSPQGLIAVCDLVDVALEQALRESPRLVAVVVDASEPGNAGTIIRVADAAGADAVVLAGDSVDVHNGKCVRASTGSVFHLPVARHRNAVDAVLQARRAGLQVLAAAADGELELDDCAELLTARTAWLFGNEAHRLAPTVAAAADHRVRIPIHGRAESLNLATAAALCLYASARAQRQR